MIRHVASIAEIVDDVDAAARFYRDVLGIPLEWEDGASYVDVKLPGILHFAIWSRRSAAEATFGDAGAIDRVPLGFSVGFEVDSVAESSEAMNNAGWKILQEPKVEPWNQTTSRFLSPSGALFEVAETPWARRVLHDLKAEGD